MSRISSQGSIVRISDNLDAVSHVIVSATKAKPCVLTLDVGAVPAVGDIVVPRFTGWNSIEGMPFKASAVAGQQVTLYDSDTSKEVNALSIAPANPPASLSVPTWMEMCRANFNANQPAGATIDVTTMCDPAHRILGGLPAIGTWTAAGFYDRNDVAMFRARDAYRTAEDVAIDIKLHDGSGWAFMAIVNTFDLTVGVNAAVANNMGGLIDGQVHFYQPAP
jgi:hypothetical protein